MPSSRLNPGSQEQYWDYSSCARDSCSEPPDMLWTSDPINSDSHTPVSSTAEIGYNAGFYGAGECGAGKNQG
ncbi:MAG: hypothetical protein STSR0009_14830 [Methanoregula sp.]